MIPRALLTEIAREYTDAPDPIRAALISVITTDLRLEADSATLARAFMRLGAEFAYMAGLERPGYEALSKAAFDKVEADACVREGAR